MRSSHRVVLAASLALAACHRGPFQLATDLHTSHRGVSRAATAHDLDAAKPLLAVTASSPAVADGIRAALVNAGLDRAGHLAVDCRLAPADPADSHHAAVTITIDGTWLALPQIVHAQDAIHGTLDYTGTSDDVRRAVGDGIGNVLVNQLRDEMPAGAGVPQPAGPARAVAVAQYIACTLHADKSVHCWSDDHLPSRIAIDGAVEIAAGSMDACARRGDGSVACWGRDGKVAPVCGVEGVTALSLGDKEGCALVAGGRVACWPLGDQAAKPGCRADAEAIDGLRDATAIASGIDESCALVGGAATCWRSDAPSPHVARPAKLGGLATLDVGFEPCGLTAAGKVACAPTEPAPLYAGASLPPGSRLVVEGMYALAVTPDGQVLGAGVGDDTLPDGTEPTPVPLPGLAHVVSVDAALDAACAVTQDGAVWCWGAQRTLGGGGRTPAKKTIY